MTASLFNLILLLVGLRMRVLRHIQVFIDQIIVNDLMTVYMLALILRALVLCDAQT